MKPAQKRFEMITITGSDEFFQKGATKIKYEIRLNGEVFFFIVRSVQLSIFIALLHVPHLYDTFQFSQTVLTQTRNSHRLDNP